MKEYPTVYIVVYEGSYDTWVDEVFYSESDAKKYIESRGLPENYSLTIRKVRR